MGIRPEEVRRVAELARIELRDEELERVAAELTVVLEYAAALQRLDLAEREPPERAAGGAALREDEVVPSALTPAQALAMAPESAGGFFVVPAFVEHVEP